jgi:ribokinase
MVLDVIGFGAMNVDKVLKAEKIPKADEESYIHSISQYSGGSAANTVVALSRLGLKTGYIGKVGKDLEGEILIKSLKDEGVNTEGVEVSEGRSGIAIDIVDKQGNRALLVDPGVNDFIEEVDEQYIEKSKFLHLTSFVCMLSNKSFETQKKVVKAYKGDISFDPGMLYAARGLKAMLPITKKARVIFPSEGEVKVLTGHDYKKGAEVLLEDGAEIVAVKLGAKGCYVTDGSKSYEIPAVKTKVVDTTGAGDAFCGGFLYGLLKGKSLKECGVLGNKVAAYCIGCVGAREGLPGLEEIKNVSTRQI